MLPDGTYPVIVVDAEGPDDAGTFHVELTVLTGDHKGELVSVAATNLGIDALSDREIIAVIAYLQRVGTDIKAKAPVVANTQP